MTRMLLGEATPGVRAGGALCFFLDMPRLSATEPRKDRMPSRPSQRAAGAVQPAAAGVSRLGWPDFTPIPIHSSSRPAADAHNRES